MKKILLFVCLIGGIGISSAQETAAQQTSPIWPGCEDSEDLKECFDQKLIEHVQENYEYPMEGREYVRGKVTIAFAINEEGEVLVDSIKGPEPKVNEAARAMIMKIPKMEPGTVSGEPAVRTFTSTYRF